MLHNLWQAILYKPLLNALALLISIIPGGDLGIAVILLTLLVKIALFPFSERQIRNQAAMALLTPELDKIKKSGESKEEQARLTFELYKKHKTNPLSGCLLVFIQIPIIFALYYVFYRGLNFDPAILYSFVHVPIKINTIFTGLLDISKKSMVLAIIAGITQFLQTQFGPKPATPSGSPGSLGESFGKSMNMQMKYIFPLLIVFIAYKISGAVALYLITSNIFAIGQQFYIKKTERALLDKEERALGIK
jgi:YidC/Oxa1 family membrane protein insertase